MEIFHLTHKYHIATAIEDYLDVYLKNKPSNCILYSQDGNEFKIHKEILCQTKFLRKLLSVTNELCCETLKICCPCSKKELEHLVNFLYDGEIHCENETESLKIQENLSKIFGFSENLSFNNPNEARHQWFTKMHCSLDIDFEAVEEKIEISFDESSENHNLNGNETPVDELVSFENEMNTVTMIEEAFENNSDHEMTTVLNLTYPNKPDNQNGLLNTENFKDEIENETLLHYEHSLSGDTKTVTVSDEIKEGDLIEK